MRKELDELTRQSEMNRMSDEKKATAMDNKEPEEVSMSPVELGFLAACDPRMRFFALNRRSLARFRDRIVQKGTAEEEFIVCINMNDPEWSLLGETLMPGHDWQSYRERGEIPVARGIVKAEGIAELLSEVVPVIAPVMKRNRNDMIRVFILSNGGASAFWFHAENDLFGYYVMPEEV
jgi:hypothetical protein